MSSKKMETLIDNVMAEYGRRGEISQVKREPTSCEIDVWIPHSYDMCSGTSAELHKGVCVHVGTSYFNGNPFPQSVYFIIDKEKGDVAYIKTLPFGGIVHATQTDSREISSGPTIIDRRTPRFAETHSKIRPGQIAAELR